MYIGIVTYDSSSFYVKKEPTNGLLAIIQSMKNEPSCEIYLAVLFVVRCYIFDGKMGGTVVIEILMLLIGLW